MTLVRRAVAQGYNVKLLFFWLNSPELAVRRVAERVAKGGHNIPEDVIRRRFDAGLHNLTHLYQPICDSVLVYNNTLGAPRLVAELDSITRLMLIYDQNIWTKISRE